MEKQKLMIKVGITGGIGSGKTTVCKLFEMLGVPVYYADDRAKWLMVNEKKVKQAIIALLGKEAYQSDGTLDRAFIASQVFKDSKKLAALNGIVHPAVALDSEQWQRKHASASYTLKEAALLFESGSYRQLDLIITVDAPESLRIQRVIERDQTTAEAVKARIDKQMPAGEKRERADFVIENDGKHLLVPQVLAIHQALLQRSEDTSASASPAL